MIDTTFNIVLKFIFFFVRLLFLKRLWSSEHASHVFPHPVDLLPQHTQPAAVRRRALQEEGRRRGPAGVRRHDGLRQMGPHLGRMR